MVKCQRAHACLRVHHESLGQFHADFFRPQQLPNACLVLQVRTRRIPKTVALAAVPRGEPLCHGHLGGIGETPVLADPPVQPFRTGFRRLNRQRLQAVRLEVVAILLGFFRPFPDSFSGRHHEKRNVIAFPILRRQHVIAQAQLVARFLPLESPGVHRIVSARREQMQGLALGLRFEKPPDGANFHERCRFVLHLFHLVVELDRLCLARSQMLLKITAISHVPPIEHERVDVTPHLAQIGNQACLAVESRHWWNRQVRSHFRRATDRGLLHKFHRSRHAHAVSRDGVLAQHALPRRRVHQLVHQAQAGHRILRVAHGSAIARRNFLLCEFRAQCRATHQQRYADAGVLQVARGGYHLLRAFHQQARESDRVRLMRRESLDQFFRRDFDSQVHDVESVVLQDDFDKVLPDVVDVAFHGRQNHFPALRGIGFFHKLLKVANGGLHGLGGLQHLGHNQFVGIEEAPDFSHPPHQWAVDNVERRCPLGTFALQVLDQSVARAFDDVVREALVQWLVFFLLLFFFLCRSEMLRDGHDVELVNRRFLRFALLAPVFRHIAQQFRLRVASRNFLRPVLEEQILRQPPFVFGN